MGLLAKNEKMVPVIFEKWEDVGDMLVAAINVVDQKIKSLDSSICALTAGIVIGGIGGIILTTQVSDLMDRVDILSGRVAELESKLMKKDEEEHDDKDI